MKSARPAIESVLRECHHKETDLFLLVFDNMHNTRYGLIIIIIQ